MSALTVAEVLDGAADLLEKPGAWTQYAFARGKSGREVTTRKAAVCFCALGAIDHVTGYDPGIEGCTEANCYLALAITGRRYGGIAKFNDDPRRTQAEVVAKLREAAALAREQQA